MVTMDLKKSFLHLYCFLKNHSYLHKLEIMERFPYPLQNPYHEWVLELMNLSDEQLIDLECYSNTQFLNSQELIYFIKETQSLSQIEKLEVSPSKIAKELNRKLTPKKTHEIQTIKSMVESIKGLSTIIDIGSGAAHLSSAIVCDNNLESFCLDLNEQFQKAGKEKLLHWCPDVLERIKFVNIEFNEGEKFEFEFNPDKALMVGLHACGPLSTSIIKSFESNKCKELINFGCCYHKLKDEYNISKLGKEYNLKFTNHALTMAAKCYSIFGLEEFRKRVLVKRFRYTLHFYCQEILKRPFKTLGNAKKKDYQGQFAKYAKTYLPDLSSSDDELNEYFYSENNQFNLRYAICAGVLRSKLARTIEIYLNIDRVLFLKEKGYDVKLMEVFERSYGPRNLGIIASK